MGRHARVPPSSQMLTLASAGVGHCARHRIAVSAVVLAARLASWCYGVRVIMTASPA